MSTVDDRVVSASFETSKFQQGVQTVLSGLDKLKAALHFPNAGKGLDDVNAAAQRMQLGHIASSLDAIKGRFTAMGIVALQVLGNIATRAVAMAGNFVKGFTFSPVMDGLHEYETNLNSVQTILANTQASGAKLKDVNAALQDLNTYSDKTIYNFGQMAKNIGTFTAAGVDLKTATGAIKGIANLAALSGSNSEQASTAMYQLSQAISAGKVSLQDWNSVVNAGMGGTVFQRALAQTATKMGTLDEGAVKLTGKMKNVSIAGNSFRDSIAAKPGEKSWLTSEVLTETLKHFTGDMTDAQLKAKGFNDQQIKAIQATAKTALHAATEVKTLTGVLDTAKESAGSGWAQTWQIIFGDFGEAKTLFTGLSNAINGFIGDSATARNKVLGDWKKLGGRTLLIKSVKNVFEDLGAVIKPIKNAFREIFPATTGKQLYDLTVRLKAFTETLKIGPDTADKLKRAFAGLFAIWHIGYQVIGGIFHLIGRLFSSFSDGNGSVLDLAASVGDFFVNLDKGIKKGGTFIKFFDKVADALEAPIEMIKNLRDAVLDFFGIDTGGQELDKTFDRMGMTVPPVVKLMNRLKEAWGGVVDIFKKTQPDIQSAISAIGDLFRSLGSALADSFKGANFSGVMTVIQTGLLGGIFLTIKKFFKKGLGESLFGGITKSITESFDALTGKLQAMQQNVKADTLMKIAIAIGLLTASIVALSMVDPEKLNKALTAMAIGFGQLLGAMAILTNVSKSAGFLKVPFIAGSLILLATAIDLLVIAVVALSQLSWEELAKGLAGVAGLLTAISIAAIPLSANSGGMIRAGLGIAAIAVAMKILASAIKDFGSMSWEKIGKGLAAVAAALVAIGLASKLFPSGMVSIGVGLIAVAFGLKLLAEAVATFGEMKWGVIGKGILVIAGALLVIAGAMQLMPANMPITAAGLILVAFALKSIGKTIESLGGLSIEVLAKGLGALAGALLILGLALTGMSGSMAGALVLGVAALGLTLIVPALERLGNMSWGEIIKGLVALAAALAVLGIAGALLAPVAPAMMAMGAALLLIGAGIALVGAGIFLIGTGLSAIAVAGPAAIAILIAALIKLSEAVPRMAENFILGLLTIVDKLSEVAPKFVAALAKILILLADTIVVAAPKLGEAFLVLIETALTVIRQAYPSILTTGFGLLKSLLKGISNNISSITATVVIIIAKIVSGIANNLSKIIRAGADLLVKFITGIASAYGKLVSAGGTVIAKIISGISSAVSKVVTAAAGLISKFISSLGSAGAQIISAGGRMISKLIEGIGNAAGRLVSKASEVAGKFIRSIGTAMLKLVTEGAKALLAFLRGLSDAIRLYEPQIIAAGIDIGKAIVEGFIQGLGKIDIIGAVKGKFSGALSAAKGLFKSHSPSEVFMDLGKNVVDGFAIGINNNDEAHKAMAAMSYGIIDGVKSIFQMESPSKVMKELGKFVGEGFAEGLMGTEEDIVNSVKNLDEKLVEAMDNARDTISEENDKLHDLLKEKHKDWDAIHDAQKVVKENEDILKRSKAAHLELTKSLDDEATKLGKLAKKYKDVSDALEQATRDLEAATSARDDAQAGFQAKFSETPDITQSTADEKHDPLGEYIKGLQDRTVAVSQYSQTLAQLRALGLDDKTYAKLLEDGTADQEFASQLLAGGATAVQGLNALDSQLGSVSKSLATAAAHNLYDAGVQSAQGLVNGLKSQQSSIYKQMEAIATGMIKAIKKKLKIKSPSEEFAEIGKFATLGMAEGLTASTKVVTDAAEYVAQEALAAMNQTFTDLALANLEMDPTITPILDLSQVEGQAKTLGDMLNVVPISAAASYNQASAISADQNTVQTALDDTSDTSGASVIKFEQNNYSPVSLSEADIYRQTKNQLSQAKAALP